MPARRWGGTSRISRSGGRSARGRPSHDLPSTTSSRRRDVKGSNRTALGSDQPMSRPSPRTKVVIFGLLGALGCLTGAIAGEALFWSPESAETASETVVITKPPKDPAQLETIVRPAAPPPALPP